MPIRARLEGVCFGRPHRNLDAVTSGELVHEPGEVGLDSAQASAICGVVAEALLKRMLPESGSLGYHWFPATIDTP